MSVCQPIRTQTVPVAPEDQPALRAATLNLCDAQVAMLGENATHGDGHTLSFKAALVERLIDQCGFDSVFFEANQDEFIHLNQRLRSAKSVTSDDLLSAVGGLWKFYSEFRPLAGFLLARARARKIFLGGLDDQLGQLGQNYANLQMISELTDLLPRGERQSCSDVLHKRIYWIYSEAAPYSRSDRSQIEVCLTSIQDASAREAPATAIVRQEREEMISSIQRWISRDFMSDAQLTVNRDRSMFQTFEWLQRRLPKKHKVIVWAATVHIAKKGDPTWGDHSGTNLGSFIHREYGKHVRSIGFSALTGSFRQGKGRIGTLPKAPADSVEVEARRRIPPGYVNARLLKHLGTRPGAFFYHSYQTLSWSEFLDCVVVFGTEHPPTDTR